MICAGARPESHPAVDAFNRRDLDAYLELIEPDVELTPYERAVEGLGPYRGHGGGATAE